jgi:hypothetical protein
MQDRFDSLLSRDQHPLPMDLGSVFGRLAGNASSNTICTGYRSVTSDLGASVYLGRRDWLVASHLPYVNDNGRTTT